MKRLWLAFAVSAVACFAVGPFVWQLVTSLRPEAQLTQLALPTEPTLASYRAIFARPELGTAVLNSALVAGTTTVVSLAIAASAGFALAKLRFPGKNVLLGATLAVSMFPPIATVSPLYLLIRSLGLLDRSAGLLLPYTTFALPLAIWILATFFRSVPDELYQAARMDGCSPLQAFIKVFLPLAAPALVTTAILVFVFAYNELMWALTFTSSPGQRTIPVAIAMFSSDHAEPWGEIAAASVVATLPLVAMTLLLQRRIVSGLTAGAVKG